MPKNLLLADDSITIQKMVGIVFAGEDFKITAVGNGEDAVARARTLKPDVILADVVMPRKNGYEVCEAIKADPELQRIPVLLLAGTFEAFDDARARTARADGHIAKPFECQALIDKVRQLVSAAQAQAPAAVAPAKPSQPVSSAQLQASAAVAPAPLAPAGRSTSGSSAAPARPAAPLPPAASQPRAESPPASAIPPAVGLPGGAPLPPGFRPPAGALQAMPRPPRFPPPPVVGQTFASTLRPPLAPRVPVSRPAATAPPPPAAAKPISAAPLGRSAWRDPFGLDAPEPPRSPAPAAPAEAAKAPPAHAVAGAPPPARIESPPPPDPALELDWSDLDVTEEENPEFAAPAQAARGGPAGEPAPAVASIDELDFGEAPPDTAAAVSLSSLGAIELPEVEPEEELTPGLGRLAPLSQEVGGRAAGARPASSPGAGDGGEAQLREALSRASREVIERIAWEVVPQLAETIIREHIDRLAKERQR